MGEKRDEKRRKEQNAYVMLLLKNGMSATTISPQATWWPPRQIHTKDKEALQFIHKAHKADLKIVDDIMNTEVPLGE